MLRQPRHRPLPVALACASALLVWSHAVEAQQTPADSSRTGSAGGRAVIFAVTLTDGEVYQARSVRPLIAFQQAEISTIDARMKRVSFDRLKSIVDAEGRDRTREVVTEGTWLGEEQPPMATPLPLRTGSAEVGADLAAGYMFWSDTGDGLLEIPIRLGVFLSPRIEVEPSASIPLSLPVFHGELASLIRLQGPADGRHLYARGSWTTFLVTPGEGAAHGWYLGLGLESAIRGRTSHRFEIGFSHLNEGPDISERDMILARVGTSYRVW